LDKTRNPEDEGVPGGQGEEVREAREVKENWKEGGLRRKGGLRRI
jgi:hypothetical protein